LAVFLRIKKLATWLYDTSVGTHLDYDQKRNIAIWSVKYLLENPDVTWEDFKNQFLMSPCEKATTAATKAKEIVSNTQINNKISSIQPNIATDQFEKGFNFGKNTSGNYAVSGTYTGTLTGLSMPSTETDFMVEGSFHLQCL